MKFLFGFLTGDLQGSEEIQPPGLRSGLVRFGQHGHHCRLLHAQGCPRRRGKSPAATLRLRHPPEEIDRQPAATATVPPSSPSHSTKYAFMFYLFPRYFSSFSIFQSELYLFSSQR